MPTFEYDMQEFRLVEKWNSKKASGQDLIAEERTQCKRSRRLGPSWASYF
jgi:hypothetical protein